MPSAVPAMFHAASIRDSEPSRPRRHLRTSHTPVRHTARSAAHHARVGQIRDRSWNHPGVTASTDAAGEPVTETTAVWALLKQADAMRPRLVGTYGLALAMWRNSMLTPTAADLALLADGIDAFSGEITLVRDAFSLANKLGPAVDPDFLARLDTWTRRLGYSRLTL